MDLMLHRAYVEEASIKSQKFGIPERPVGEPSEEWERAAWTGAARPFPPASPETSLPSGRPFRGALYRFL